MSTQEQYNFDEIIDRSNTNSVKFDAVPFLCPDLPDDFISMWVADQDFACAPPILEAMHKRLDRKILGYSSILDLEYNQTVANWMKKRHGWDAMAHKFTFSAGVVNAVRLAISLLTKPGDGVIVNTPGYHPFDDVPKALERKVVYSKLIENDGYYTVNYDDLEEKCKDPNNKVFILCNPQNPTGRVWKEEELRKMADICLSHNIFIISDEIHSDLIKVGLQHIPLAKLYPNEKRLIVCTAPSKTFNLATNQLSNIYIPDPKLRQDWNTGFRAGFPNALSIEACKAAYTQCEPWLDQLKIYLDGNFQMLHDRLQAELPQVIMSPREGTYLAWLNFEKLGLSDDELKQRITRAGVFLEYSNDFIADAQFHIRMNLSCPRKVLNEAITRVIKALTTNYVAPQFEGHLNVNDSFPVDKLQIPKEGQKKTVLYFLRYFGCPITQLILKDLNENLQKECLDSHQDVKVLVYLNSSERNFHKLNPEQKDIPYTLKFDLDGVSYKELKIRPASQKKFIIDGKALHQLEMTVELGMNHLGKEEKSDDNQRPATFIIDDQGKVQYSKYGHGAGDIPSAAELAKLL